MTINPFFPLEQQGSPVPSGPLDPEEVYRWTRPADWLKMPDVANAPGNLYALVLIPQGATVCFPLLISGAAVRIEYGYTDSSGTFICTSVCNFSNCRVNFVLVISSCGILPYIPRRRSSP